MGRRLSLALFGREEPADPSYKNAIIHFRFRARRRECWIGHQDEGSALSRIPTPLVDEIVRFFTPLSIVNPRPRNKEHTGVIEIMDGYELWLPRQAAERRGYQFREGRVIPPPRSSPVCVIS